MKFNEMTEELAKLEGEGDLSLSHWRETHYNYFKSISSKFNEESLIVFEIFEMTKNLVK